MQTTRRNSRSLRRLGPFFFSPHFYPLTSEITLEQKEKRGVRKKNNPSPQLRHKRKIHLLSNSIFLSRRGKKKEAVEKKKEERGQAYNKKDDEPKTPF
ncbi:hypothetical protein TNCT_265731 [Trichonephila clavata]|uniref:Uncharacterized protein n=1 Tax=Trichonephila clavata TaxID=2740835 RepID=A0A8X6G8Q4_TRICU|nr:hypothetical protein TNCT_265731 [Trichonephila clavata]